MKNVFGTKLTKEENSNFDGECFVYKNADAESEKALDDLYQESESYEKRASFPLALSILKYACLFLGLIAIAGILRSDVSFAEGFQNAPYIYIGGALALIVGGGLHYYEKFREQKQQKSEEYKEFHQREEELNRIACAELGIPEHAKRCTVFSFIYKDKKNKIVSALPFTYMPLEQYIYADEERLYLADVSSVYAFHLSEIKEIRHITKRYTIGAWTKDQPCRAEEYKSYNIRVDQFGFVHLKEMYAMTIESSFETFEILFPPYELETVQALLGASVPVNADTTV